MRVLNLFVTLLLYLTVEYSNGGISNTNSALGDSLKFYSLSWYNIGNESEFKLINNGNALSQELRWINISSRCFDAGSYLQKMPAVRCCPTIRQLRETVKQVMNVNRKFGESSAEIYSPRRQVRDCNYSISPSEYSDHQISFHIYQSNCTSAVQFSRNIQLLSGGSSFETFARFNDSIVGCSVTDNFSFDYIVRCPYQGIIHTPSKLTYFLSIILTFEYYDGFGEYPRNQLLDIIYDDYEVDVVIHKQESDSNIHKGYHPIPSNPIIFWYSAIWHKKGSSMNNIIRHHSFLSTNTSLDTSSSSPKLLSMNQHLAEINISFGWNIFKSNIITYNSYKHMKFIYSKYNEGNIFACASSSSSSSSSSSNGRKSMSTAVRGTPSKMNYRFIGSSHMRYTYDYMLVKSYGIKPLLNMSRKHESVTYNRLAHDYIRHAADMAQYLREFCTTKTTADERVTLVLETGHWDLVYYTLRAIIHDQGSGMSLVNVTKDILTGDLSCPGLAHVVWVTTVPHPLHYEDPLRSFRFNNNIRAQNDFYISQLLAVTPQKQMRFSVVDAFSIIYPRLALNEREETVCGNHFLCRSEEGLDRILVTPAGLAMVDAITSSICDYEDQPENNIYYNSAHLRKSLK